jgi:hypothetical protein
MKTKHVKPAAGLKIRDYYGRDLPEDGAIVPWNSFWQRLERDGDVTIVEPKKKSVRKKETQTQTEEN